MHSQSIRPFQSFSFVLPAAECVVVLQERTGLVREATVLWTVKLPKQVVADVIKKSDSQDSASVIDVAPLFQRYLQRKRRGERGS